MLPTSPCQQTQSAGNRLDSLLGSKAHIDLLFVRFIETVATPTTSEYRKHNTTILCASDMPHYGHFCLAVQ